MSHSQFHCTNRVHLDMHGLIFETSICYWQDQPGSCDPRQHARPAARAPTRAGPALRIPRGAAHALWPRRPAPLRDAAGEEPGCAAQLRFGRDRALELARSGGGGATLPSAATRRGHARAPVAPRARSPAASAGRSRGRRASPPQLVAAGA